MALNSDIIIARYKEIIEKGFDEYVSKDIRDALNNYVQYVYENANSDTAIFASEQARDDYFKDRTNELVNGMPIIVQKGDAANPQIVTQIWNGITDPPTYNSANWTEVGSISGGTIPDKFIFADDTARNAYFDPNKLNEILPGISIIVNGVIQKWAAETPLNSTEYNNGANWVDVTGNSLTAAQIKSLYESNANTNALIDSKNQILNFLSYSNDIIVSEKSIEVPPGTVYIGEGTGISAGVLALNVFSSILNRRGLLLSEIYDDTGKLEAPIFDIAALSFVDVNLGDTEQQNTAQFTITSSNPYELIRRIYTKTNVLSGSVNVNFVIKNDNASGDILFSYQGTLLTNAIGVAALELSNPLLVSNTLQLYVDCDVDGLLGSTIGSTYTPYLRIQLHVVTPQEIASEAYVDQEIGNVISVHDFSLDIPAAVPLTTNLGIRNLEYRVTNHAKITSLYLQSNSVNFQQLSNPTDDGLQKVTVDLSGLNTTSQTTYIFRLQANAVKNSNTQTLEVRNAAAEEKIYYGIGNINPVIVDPTSLIAKEVYEAGQFDVTLGPSQLNQDIVFLAPQNRDITEILNKDVFDINVINAYTKVIGVRTIGTQLYNSFELPNLNASLTFRYTIKYN